MSCPSAREWDLLAMELLEGEQAERMRAHARSCTACREQFQAARQAHTERIRMYEAFDRAHDEQREQLVAALSDEAPGAFRDGWVQRGWRRLGGVAMSLNKSAARRVAVSVWRGFKARSMRHCSSSALSGKAIPSGGNVPVGAGDTSKNRVGWRMALPPFRSVSITNRRCSSVLPRPSLMAAENTSRQAASCRCRSKKMAP